MTPDGLAIQTSGLTRRFDGRTAVSGLDLEVRRGELFALLGPNGAGKTTTVRMLACLIAPSEGEAKVLGHDVRHEPDAVRARVGLLTESPGLYERLTARDNLLYFARLQGVADPAGTVERYLRMMDLWDRRDERTGGFSKGMKQRMALARALLHEPDLLFLDEPTSGLDPAATHAVREFLRTLRSEGRTILLTTHNLDEAERLADRIGILRERLVSVDTPEGMRRRLYGRRTVVTFAGEAAAFLDTARALPFVASAEAQGARLLLELGDPDAQTPDLVSALVGAGARLRAVGEERATLEAVYLQIVGEAVS